MKRPIDDGVAQIRILILGARITNDFNADYQSAASDVADDLEVFRPISKASEEVVSHAAGVFLVLAFDQVHGGQRGCQTHWVSAEGGAVPARPPAHHAFSGDDGPERHSAGNNLRR